VQNLDANYMEIDRLQEFFQFAAKHKCAVDKLILQLEAIFCTVQQAIVLKCKDSSFKV
jgi:hypothetical protein